MVLGVFLSSVADNTETQTRISSFCVVDSMLWKQGIVAIKTLPVAAGKLAFELRNVRIQDRRSPPRRVNAQAYFEVTDDRSLSEIPI